jgi:hypothetical protein
MTKRNAEKCCEVMAELNDHFEKWCYEKGYAWTHPIYDCFAIKGGINPRVILREYRKTYGFTADQYRYWFKHYSFHYGDFDKNSTI